jgi:KUP system potassium uptake protein
MLFLAYSSVGVIYGDIGTSPLYVFSSTFTGPPSRTDLLGALSLIIWSLTLMVTVKYVLIILHADNDGEGGTFSTYSLLARYANIANRDPREASLIRKSAAVTLMCFTILNPYRHGKTPHE